MLKLFIILNSKLLLSVVKRGFIFTEQLLVLKNSNDFA